MFPWTNFCQIKNVFRRTDPDASTGLACAPVSEKRQNRAKRAGPRVSYRSPTGYVALSGLVMLSNSDPGRCPGLGYGTPAGLKTLFNPPAVVSPFKTGTSEGTCSFRRRRHSRKGKPETGSRKPEAGSRKSDVRCRKTDARGRMSDTRKPEVGFFSFGR